MCVWLPVASCGSVCVVSVSSYEQEEERHPGVREEVWRDIDCTVLRRKWMFCDEGDVEGRWEVKEREA